ncbi:MAG: hypothetical protein IKB02_00715 [Clostridia bacterium]|nr:hypothetical protein [Clostridia bacterium]
MKKANKRLLLLCVAAALISTVIYLLLSAVYTVLASNLVYNSYLTVIDVVLWLVNVLSYTVIFSILIISVSRNGVKRTLPLIFSYCGIVLFKNLSASVLNGVILGVGLSAPDLLYPLLVWLFDVILAFAVLLVAFFKSNNLSAVALICGVLLSATTLLPRIIYDIGYGAPSGTEDLLVMITAYASDLLVIAVFYFVSHFLFKYLQRGELK